MCSGILPFVILILINLFQTHMKKQLISVMVAASLLTACGGAPKTTAEAEKFDYTVEQFADLQILRYRVPEFENLSLKQKELVYYLTEAALQGRDILFDQNGKYNLRIRRMLEAVYTGYTGDKSAADFKAMEVYLKRVWFSNGIHHHYGCEKFVPGFTPEFFKQALLSVDAATLPLAEGQTVEQLYEEVAPVIFDPKVMPKRVNQAAGEDLVLTSACNYYDGVTQQEAEAFYSALKDPKDETPVSYGLNSRLVKENGKIREKVWKAGGLYGAAIGKIVYWLKKAEGVAENPEQKAVIAKLIEFYETGDLKTFDDYAILWVKDLDSRIDFVNGFTESYGDPLGMKAIFGELQGFGSYPPHGDYQQQCAMVRRPLSGGKAVQEREGERCFSQGNHCRYSGGRPLSFDGYRYQPAQCQLDPQPSRLQIRNDWQYNGCLQQGGPWQRLQRRVCI